MGASASFDPRNEDQVNFLSEENDKWNNQDTIRISEWKITKSWNNYPVLRDNCVSIKIAGFGGAGLGTFGQNLNVVSVTDNFIIAEHNKGNIYRLDIDKKCEGPFRRQDWIDRAIQSYFLSIIPEEFKGIYNYFWIRQHLINIPPKKKDELQEGGAYENYNYIINPIDNKKYKTDSMEGRSIIKMYTKQLKK